jgi:RimJ/RimL family protein N-acetyltransferase
LFHWVNQADSIAAKALTQEPIPRARHEEWFAARLLDPDTFLHVIEDNGVSIGQVRLQLTSPERYAVDIYVDQPHRGQGVAAWAVQEAIRNLLLERSRAGVVALVRVENAASAALFTSIGFHETKRTDGFVEYEWSAPV